MYSKGTEFLKIVTKIKSPIKRRAVPNFITSMLITDTLYMHFIATLLSSNDFSTC